MVHVSITAMIWCVLGRKGKAVRAGHNLHLQICVCVGRGVRTLHSICGISIFSPRLM